MIKVASWNIAGAVPKSELIARFLEQEKPDLLFLQETRTNAQRYPDIPDGYRARFFHGVKGRNGVGMFVTRDIATYDEAITLIEGDDDSAGRVLLVEAYDLVLINMYVPNGRAPGHERYFYKLAWLAELDGLLESYRDRNLVIMGDMNICPTPTDTWDPMVWHDGRLTCTPHERTAYSSLLRTHNLVDNHDGQFTFVDNKNYWKTQWRTGLRLDHMLTNETLRRTYASRSESLQLWRDDKLVDDHGEKMTTSDHAPVMLYLARRP